MTDKQTAARKAPGRLARLGLALTFAALATALLGAAAARAAVGPLTDVKALWADTDLPPGGEGLITVRVRNVGDQALSQPLKVIDQLPAGVTATEVRWPHVNVPAEVTAWGETYHVNWQVHLAEFCTGNGPGAAPKIVGATVITCEVPAEMPFSYYGVYPGKAFIFQQLGLPLGRNIFSIYEPSLTRNGWLPELRIEAAVDSAAAGTGANVATVEGGGAPTVTDTDQIPFSATPAPFGVVPGGYEGDVFAHAYPFGPPSRQAGDHPFEQRVNVDVSQKLAPAEVWAEKGGGGLEPIDVGKANGLVRTVEVTLPRGLIGNPESLPKCDPTLFAQVGSTSSSTKCPADTQVGYLDIRIGTALGNSTGGANQLTGVAALYNLKPPYGTPVDLGFVAGGWVEGHIFAALDPAQNYAIRSVTPDIGAMIATTGFEVTLWGVPADPAHDRFRFYPESFPAHEYGEYGEELRTALGAPWGSAPIRPFYINPMDCGFDNGGHRLRINTYEDPEFTPVQEDPHPLNVEGCNDPRFRFEPEVAMQPTDRHAGAPTGLDVHLKVPLRNDEVSEAKELYASDGHVKGISTPPMKKAVVTFPEGMTLSPSAAQGLTGCTSAEIGLGTDSPVRCPDSSQYGTLILHTPLLPIDEQPHGFIYIAKQNENPYHNFLSLYLVVEEPARGVLVKIPARLDLDPQTGRITTTFDDLPQFPVSDLQMTFKGGVRAGLVEPSTCGEKTIRAEFFTWQDPQTPHVVTERYDITERPDGSPCVNSLAERPFHPTLEAGTENNRAGAYSPFNFLLTRTDDDQEFSQLGVTAPKGLLGKLAGVSECPEKAIEQAQEPERSGTEEKNNPSCPASSLLGTTEVGTGVGVPLSWVPGRVYLAGPYKGAPLSMVVISPVLIGPYDLGVIAVRSALEINPESTQASVLTDPFPLIYKGIPVRIRDIRVMLDRPEFTLNPTNCEPTQVQAHITGTGGDLLSTADDTATDLSQRYQVADCGALGFKPKLSLRLYGGTHRNAHPKLRAILKMPAGGANIAWAQVAMPHAEFLDQSHLNTVCTRVQFAASQCPAGSLIGHAEAVSPLLAEPLKGPVYLRSSSHNLPDVVAHLVGQVTVDQVATIDSVNGGLRATFEAVPDAPIDSFTFTMQGGKRGLLVNSEELCGQTLRASADFKAQNGLRTAWAPKLKDACGRRGKHRHARR